jgi:ATP-NAD kinase N-terminal domain
MSGTFEQKKPPSIAEPEAPPHNAADGHSRPSLKRVNTPPNLNLLRLFSTDPIHQHKRSQSAAGGEQRDSRNMMHDGALSAGIATMRPATSASAMSALQIGMDSLMSPCFVHKTFGGSINLERVLAECRADEMTHQNLLQTATGVREVARQLGITVCLYFTYHLGRAMVKTQIKSVMIVTKARDHSLVQLTRDLAKWLMTTTRHGKPYGVKVFVDSKLEKSRRFDADGLYKDHDIIRQKNLLQFWTLETCAYADTFDFVITVVSLHKIKLMTAWWRWNCIVYFKAVSANCPTRDVLQFWLPWISHQFPV